MSIPYAYCQEVDRVIDIMEAHEVFFARDPVDRRRLTFLCPDQSCRESARPTVTGVNYDKLPYADRIIQKPHFRFTSGQPHASGCPWGELVALIEDFDREPRQPRTANLKRSELITNFNPLEGDQDAEQDGDLGRLRDVMSIEDRQGRRVAIRNYLNDSLTKTARLHEVARCYEAMSPEERGRIALTIGQTRRTYAQYFADVRYCTPEHYYNRIYHGVASVMRYPRGYSIRFGQSAWLRDRTRCSVSVFITPDQLQGFRGRTLLTAALDEASHIKGNSLYCYVFGTVERQLNNGELTSWINVTPSSLQSLAVTLTENGENQENT